MLSEKANEIPWSDAERMFVAENTTVDILPTFSYGVLSLICGDYGPFVPSKFVSVPLWLAMHLRKSFHCRIICPNWMEIDQLEKHVRDETEFSDTFSPLPFCWQEISQAILSVAFTDISNADEIQKLLQQLKETRENKLFEGLKEMDSRPLELTNIGCAELNKIKPYLIAVADQLSQFSSTFQKTQQIRPAG